MRKRGYKFHYAVVPVQQMRHGLVNIHIKEVSLGDVHIINRSSASAGFVKSMFKPLLGKPLYQPDIDKAIAQLKALPEISAFAYYSRGSEPDSIRLNIKLDQQERFQGQLGMDNFGSSATGEARLLAQAQWLSPTGRFDRLSGGLLVADGEAEANTYGYLVYRAPLRANLKHHVTVSASNNVFGVGGDFNSLELNGDATNARLAYDYSFARSVSSEQKLIFSAETKENDLESEVDDPIIEQDEHADLYGVTWLWNQNIGRTASQHLSIGYFQGEFSVDSQIDEPLEYSKFSLNYQLNVTEGNLAEDRFFSRWLLALRGQMADSRVSSFDQVALTGAYGQRSLKPGIFSADVGGVATTEWHFPNLFGAPKAEQNWRLEPFWLLDYAQGDKLDIAGEVIDSASLLGTGLGINGILNEQWYLTVIATHTLEAEFDSGIDAEDFSFLAKLEYRW